MLQSDIERVDRLLNAELTYYPKIEEKYGKASRQRMSELKARLLEVINFPAVEEHKIEELA